MTVEVARSAGGTSAEKLVRVPRAAVVAVDPDAGSALIFVVQGEQAASRWVAVASMSERSVDVASGIAVGDEVITQGQSALRDGDRVLTVGRR